ncbi:uncharacterized protein LOC124537735 [Vanessa cardui]|uniref:uncharacterized protein LOC124537735 n=1 Tax=Vanessa cardui TaxID=171605 RepID=UPI001F13961C|nr:uncharacterized protein LOC124537735 [Vanessa cardui]
MGCSVATAILVRVPADTLDELRKAYPGTGGTTWMDKKQKRTLISSTIGQRRHDGGGGRPGGVRWNRRPWHEGGTSGRPERLSESVCSMRTLESIDIPHKDVTRRRGEKRTHAEDSCSGSESDASVQLSENSESSASRWLKSANKRGRGRPPTHGKYVGLGKSQAERHEAKSKTKDDRFQTEDALAAYNEAAKSALDVVLQVANKSGNLKRTFVKALKTAADTIKCAVAELKSLTMSEKVVRLEAANAKLSGQLAELRREVAEMHQKPPVTDADSKKRIVEEALRCSNMLNARMEGIERRLLPESRLRPPLAADPKAAQTAVASTRVTVPAELTLTPTPEKSVGNTTAAQRKKKAKRPTMPAQEAVAAAAKKTAPTLTPKPGSSGVSWAAVVRQQPSKPTKKATGPTPKPTKAGTPETVPTKNKKKAHKRLRSPRTAVIMITLRPGAEKKGLKYETVLAQAKSSIQLSEVGLTTVRFRTAATARMLDISPGTADAEKSEDALVDKLRSVLSLDEVQIHRPTKYVEIRVMDLDDSVTSEEVVAAVAEEGGCSVDAIRPGVVVRGANGCRSLWLSCPVAAAKKILGYRGVAWGGSRLWGAFAQAEATLLL